jgi:hypothetical protein
MSENSTFSANESLRLFLLAPSEAESAKLLEALIEKCVLPTIEKILRAKFGDAKREVFSEQDYEDLCGECGLKIVGVLRSRKIAPEDFLPIKDFSAYCAAIVYNVWNGFVREKTPNRENLKNKIRYALDKDYRFVKADGDSGNLYCLKDHNIKPSAMSVERLTAIVKAENEFFAPVNLPELLAAIFEKAGGSLKIEMLVKVIADLWQVRDFPAVSLDDFYESDAPLTVRREDYEMRCKLEYLWKEIRALPVLQRVALLYNLRDERGGEMVLSFFNTRIAALDELAGAMNLTKAQFVKLLPQLPFEDKKIAAAMNLNVKQIGNLRKTARDNLRRRLDGKTRRAMKTEETEIYSFIGDDEDGAAMANEFLN